MGVVISFMTLLKVDTVKTTGDAAQFTLLLVVEKVVPILIACLAGCDILTLDAPGDVTQLACACFIQKVI